MSYSSAEARHPGRQVKDFENTFWKSIQQTNIINKDCTLLDLGAGNGRFSHFFSDKVKSVVALEPYDTFDKRYNSNNIEFVNEKLETFSDNRKFDVCFMWGVFYIFYVNKSANTFLAFDKMLTTLKDTGYLIIVEADTQIKTVLSKLMDDIKDKYKCSIILQDIKYANLELIIVKKECLS